MAIASIKDVDVRQDMNNINWNPFNSNENAVLNSSKVSFYKGMPVFRTDMERSGSFFGIFLSRGYYNNAGVFCPENDPDTVRHEWGHGGQLILMGPIIYGLMIGLPSACEWSTRSYYERPWEITADIHGGVTGRTHANSDISRGRWYLAISSAFGPFGYFFLIGEY